ncbi:MAG TPA: DUF6351 family protein [Propionibacteriaceae bacterium]
MRDRVDERGSSLSISVLSSRPDAITGGSVMIQVFAPDRVPLTDVRVGLNDQDVTGQLRLTDVGLTGVLTGLTASVNTVRASAPGAQDASTTVTNHPISGPLLSGSQQRPFVCELGRFRSATGTTLVDDGTCSLPSSAAYVYRSRTTGKFVALAADAVTDPERRPRDVADLPAVEGVVRPFIVRVETLTIDRGVAQIAMLDDPADGAGSAWNRKLIYGFGGGGCGSGHRQGDRTYEVLSPNLLAQGFAIASNSLNVSLQNCSDLVAAEAFAMTREHFIKEHGLPAYTMGIGCSGGAAQAYQIADNYPGLLDGIVAGCSLADIGFDLGQLAFDARLLAEYARRHPSVLTPAQLTAVSGLGSTRELYAMSRLAQLHDQDPSTQLLPRQTTGVDGVRGSIWDQYVNVYGTSSDGAVRRPVGNLGVQYGLAALERGVITPEQFVQLNEGIGGLNDSLGSTPTRTTPDATAVRAAYASGRLLSGAGGLGDIPIIDYRSYSYGPGQPSLDLRYHTFVVQERLIRANGNADNQVRLTDSGRGRFDVERGVLAEAIGQMDRWITAVKGRPTSGRFAVAQSKPADLVDACWTPTGRKIVEPQDYAGAGECNRLYPSTATPRMVAGGPLAGDVLSCVLEPPDRERYPATMTQVQFLRLDKLFRAGVCDFAQGGEGQQRLSGTWLNF